jgi:DNA replication protein DnaC
MERPKLIGESLQRVPAGDSPDAAVDAGAQREADSPGSPPASGPRCLKCGCLWGATSSERLQPWCAFCAYQHGEEYKAAFRAHVLGNAPLFLARANVPVAFRECGLHNYQVHDANQRRAQDAVKGWAASAGQAGLYLYGPPGTGKTHLAAACLLELLARQWSGRYVSVAELLLEARESFGDRRVRPLSAILDRCTDIDALLLDDLCAEKSTEFAREVFLTIADRAYGRRRPVLIVTSNLDLAALERKLDERIADRLRGLCIAVKVGGGSHRRRVAGGRG